MTASRQVICEKTGKKLLAAAATLGQLPAVVGFDGFVDEIIAVVDKRQDHEHYEAVGTIAELSKKIARAAGESSNYELVVKHMKLGGNGPIMANALASAGMAVTYIGNLGYPAVHPVFEDFARKAKVISIAEPAHTDALEFQDGKLMLGKLTPLSSVNWDSLVSRVGFDALRQLVHNARLIGMVNWTMLPHMSRIWEKMSEQVLTGLDRGNHKIFIDLADPEKRTLADIRFALDLLTRIQGQVDVILGLNLKESSEILEVLDQNVPADAESAIENTARIIREKLKLYCVVIHPRRGAAAATENHSAAFAGPFVQQPRISTGAGDHFNAGFALGQVLGFDLEESLCTGVATSGYYVRHAQSPTAVQLAEFIEHLPAPQG